MAESYFSDFATSSGKAQINQAEADSAANSPGAPGVSDHTFRKSTLTGLIGAATIASTACSIILLNRSLNAAEIVVNAIFVLAISFTVMAAVELFVCKSYRTHFSFSESRKIDRVAAKRILRRASSVMILFLVQAIPVLLIHLFYAPVFPAFLLAFPLALAISVCYFCLWERNGIGSLEHDDWLDFPGLLKRNMALLFSMNLGEIHTFNTATGNRFSNMLLSAWLRSFFGTLLFVYFITNFQDLQRHSLSLISSLSFNHLYTLLPVAYVIILRILCTVDSGIAAIGYLSASRIFGTEVRSIDKSWMGWFVTLICYHPFCMVDHYADAVSTYAWPEQWLTIAPLAWCAATALLMVLMFLYAWSNLSFGMAFSNLTNRGIVASGPYAFVRHPAYSIKITCWWICTIPFILERSGTELATTLLGMILVTSIFYLRAITEERHLLKDENYRAYTKLVPWRFIPFLI